MARRSPLPPFEQLRLEWYTQGFTVLANLRTDTALLTLARRARRLVRIGRRTRWGNPYVLSKEATMPERLASIQAYHDDFHAPTQFQPLLESLIGKVLACWCTPLPCHGEVFLEAIDPGFAQTYRCTCQELAPVVIVRTLDPTLSGPKSTRRLLEER